MGNVSTDFSTVQLLLKSLSIAHIHVFSDIRLHVKYFNPEAVMLYTLHEWGRDLIINMSDCHMR